MRSLMAPLTEEITWSSYIEIEREDLHIGGGIIIGSAEI